MVGVVFLHNKKIPLLLPPQPRPPLPARGEGRRQGRRLHPGRLRRPGGEPRRRGRVERSLPGGRLDEARVEGLSIGVGPGEALWAQERPLCRRGDLEPGRHAVQRVFAMISFGQTTKTSKAYIKEKGAILTPRLSTLKHLLTAVNMGKFEASLL